MRILLLVETLMAGGAETFVIRLANALVARNQVAVAVLHGDRVEPQFAEQLRPAVQLHRLRTPGERWWWRVDRVLRALRLDWSFLRSRQRRWLAQLVGEFRPDVVHSHLLKADRLMLETIKGGQVGRVTTLHGDYEPYLQGQADPHMLDARRWIVRMLEEADSVVGICRAHQDSALRLSPNVGSRLRIIYNGYEPSNRSGDPADLTDELFRFGMVSRGVRLKGWRLAVDAFARIRDGRSRLTLVGDGPAIAELRADQPPDVEFVGFSADPLRHIAKFDVCLLPTLFPHESLPTAIVEYLACGKPVIATDVGEISTMLSAPDGRSAGVLLAFDGEELSVDQLSGAMATLRSDPELRHAMGDAALEAFARFRMEDCLGGYESVYHEVTERIRGRSAGR